MADVKRSHRNAFEALKRRCPTSPVGVEKSGCCLMAHAKNQSTDF